MKIAIVDDEEKWRNLVSYVLKDYTEETDKIDTFESGVEFIKKNGEYNVVLMDVDMPEMDGSLIRNKFYSTKLYRNNSLTK